MGQLIIFRSGTISYNILVITLFFLYIADRLIFVRKDDFGNATLFFALCLSMVIKPIVEFFVARRYR